MIRWPLVILGLTVLGLDWAWTLGWPLPLDLNTMIAILAAAVIVAAVRERPS